jgi:CRP-like cAMP-binding protein
MLRRRTMAKTKLVGQRHRTSSGGKSIQNQPLLAIPDDEFALIRPHLYFVNLAQHLTLHQPHRTLRFAHFPNRGLISLIVEMKDGKSAEAGLLGNEGTSGMSGVLGLAKSPLLEIVQIEGNGFRVAVSTLKEIVRLTPKLRGILSRYAAGLAMQVAQTAACNRLHKIEERFARWLLMAQDRVNSEVVAITHDFLGTMLGTDRPSVSLAAGVLQRKEIIKYARGSVKILNRKKLEHVACECYGIIRQYDGQADE